MIGNCHQSSYLLGYVCKRKEKKDGDNIHELMKMQSDMIKDRAIMKKSSNHARGIVTHWDTC